MSGMAEVLAARRLKRTRLSILAVMNGLGWDQMDNGTRAAAIALKLEECHEFINDTTTTETA